jgi:hypothetical protein
MINSQTNNKRGFSLLETLLATVIVSGLFVIIFNILDDYAESMLARSTSTYMDNISTAIEELIENPVNYQNIYAEADSRPNGVLELEIADIINGFNANGAFIDPSASINDSIRTTTPLKVGLEIMIRVADDPSDPSDDQALEIILATNEPAREPIVRRAAEFSKVNGGFYNQVGEARSAFATWRFDPLVNLAGSSWASAITTEPPSPDNGIYLVHYSYQGFESIVGDYLYRVEVTGRPDLNEIYNNLNMGGNNILGADNINPTGDVAVNSKIISNGNIIANDMTFQEGNFNAAGNMQVGSAIIHGRGGGLTGNFSTQRQLAVTNTLQLSGNLASDQATLNTGLQATNSLSVGNVNNVSDIQTQDMFVTRLDGGSAAALDVGNQLTTNRIETDDVVVSSGDIGFIDGLFDANVNVGGSMTSTDIIMDVLTVDQFGACDNDCYDDIN